MVEITNNYLHQTRLKSLPTMQVERGPFGSFSTLSRVFMSAKFTSTATRKDDTLTTPPSKCQNGPINQSILILKTTDSHTVRTVVGALVGIDAGEVKEAGGIFDSNHRTRPVVAEVACVDDRPIDEFADTGNNKL